MIDITKKIMDAMKAHDKVASETYKLIKAKILEFKTQKNAPEYNDDGRACTNLFYLYTNTKYNVGDTIIIGDTIHKAR